MGHSHEGFSYGSRRRGPRGFASGRIIACIVAVCLVVLGVHLWTTRAVAITVNGQQLSIRNGSTMDEVVAATGANPTAGDLVSVSGKTLTSGGGNAYTASANGTDLDQDATAAYRVRPNDDITISDGADRMEDYDVSVEQDAPKLEMSGDAMGNISYISQWPKAGTYEMRTGRVSGETARGDTLTDTQNAVVTVHQITPSDSSRKLVALTFDDGPAEGYTEKYLDILDQYGIHATFFNLGQSIDEYPDLAKEIVDRGSEVMSHTHQHQQLSKLGAEALQAQFSDAFTAINDVTGVNTTAFRPPYGDFNEKAWLNSGGLASVSVIWNQDSEDWRRPGVDSIVANSEKGVTSGSIILMHDGGGNRDQDVEALPRIIEDLQGQGYEFVTVSELMQSDDSIPDDIAAGNATMPDDATWPTEIASK